LVQDLKNNQGSREKFDNIPGVRFMKYIFLATCFFTCSSALRMEGQFAQARFAKNKWNNNGKANGAANMAQQEDKFAETTDALPSFYIHDAEQGCDPEHTWDDTIKQLADHPSRINDEKAATFSMRCMHWENGGANFLALPQRSKEKPYIFWGLTIASHYPAFSEAMKARTDFLFTSFDRREHISDNKADPIPGITFPPTPMHSVPHNPEDAAKYFLTFRGKMRHGESGLNSHIRESIQKVFEEIKEPGVVVEILDGKTAGHDAGHDYDDLLNTSFALVPAGHGRWSFRLIEVMMSGAIPVIMADGLTLPLEDLIDWGKNSVILQEADAEFAGITQKSDLSDLALRQAKELYFFKNPQKILHQLPRDPRVIQQMRQNVVETSQRYFDTQLKMFESLLTAAAVHNGIGTL